MLAAQVSRREEREVARATLTPTGALSAAPRKTEPDDVIAVRRVLLERALTGDTRFDGFCVEEDRLAVTPTVWAERARVENAMLNCMHTQRERASWDLKI